MERATKEGAPVEVILAGAARVSALVAAGLTVTGAATISAFFAAGQPWGTINDLNTIALSASTFPIAVGLRSMDPDRRLLIAALGANLAGAAVTIGASAALVAELGSFEGTLPVVLTGQGLIGAWMVLAGAGLRNRLPRRIWLAGGLGGLGLAATAIGFGTGGSAHPLTTGGGVLALLGTTAFYAQLGLRRVTHPRPLRTNRPTGTG